MLYTYAVKIGTKQLVHGDINGGARHLLIPQSYWRNVECRFVLQAGEFKPTDRILDIGSPKVLSLYLAKHLGANVYSTDIDDYFIREYTHLRAMEGLSPDRFHIQTEDGRHLSFADNSLDKVYAISVLEHIPDCGDSETVREMGRVLEPGGRAMITVPFLPKARNEYWPAEKLYWAAHSKLDEDGRVFFQRRYDETDLHDRLITPSGLRLRSLQFVGERVFTNAKRELYEMIPFPVAVATGTLQVAVSTLVHTPPTSAWRELRKPLCALICLEKPE